MVARGDHRRAGAGPLPDALLKDRRTRVRVIDIEDAGCAIAEGVDVVTSGDRRGKIRRLLAHPGDGFLRAGDIAAGTGTDRVSAALVAEVACEDVDESIRGEGRGD